MCKKGLYPQNKFNSHYSTIYYRKSMKMAVRKSIIMLFRYQSLLVFSVKQAFKVHVQCMYLITSKVRTLKEYFSFSRNLCTKMSCPTPLLQYQSCSANIFCCQIFVWKCTTSESLKLQFSWGSMPHTPPRWSCAYTSFFISANTCFVPHWELFWTLHCFYWLQYSTYTEF